MASSDVNRLIDMLYERIEEAKAPALKPGMSIVDRDEMLDLLDELRAQLPVEVKRAQELLSAREKFVEEAKRDVDRMMRPVRRYPIARCFMLPRKRRDRSLPTRRNAPAFCIRWRMSMPRMRWHVRRRQFRLLWMRLSSSGSGSGRPLLSRCRSSAPSWSRRRSNQTTMFK